MVIRWNCDPGTSPRSFLRAWASSAAGRTVAGPSARCFGMTWSPPLVVGWADCLPGARGSLAPPGTGPGGRSDPQQGQGLGFGRFDGVQSGGDPGCPAGGVFLLHGGEPVHVFGDRVECRPFGAPAVLLGVGVAPQSEQRVFPDGGRLGGFAGLVLLGFPDRVDQGLELVGAEFLVDE